MGKYSIAFTKGLPYGPFLKQAIFDLTEKGQLHRIKNKWKIYQPDCAPLRNSGISLSFKKLSSLFILIISGFILAVFCFLIENIFCFWMQKTPQKQDEIKIRRIIEELREIAVRRKSQCPKLLSLLEHMENST